MYGMTSILKNINRCCTFHKYNILKKPILIINAPNGSLVCKYFNITTANKTGEAICTFSNVNNFEDILNSEAIDVSDKAKELGIKEGMYGLDIIHKML